MASLEYNKKDEEKDFVIGLINQTYHRKNHPKFLTHLVFCQCPTAECFCVLIILIVLCVFKFYLVGLGSSLYSGLNNTSSQTKVKQFSEMKPLNKLKFSFCFKMMSKHQISQKTKPRPCYLNAGK